jgi:hypothetical protein
LGDDLFRQRVVALRAEMTHRALGKLTDGAVAAADTLQALLAAESESARLGAARSILELGAKLNESVSIEARLAALEARLAEAGGSGK